ncbi:hypothetical protein CRG98_034309 [Punica granatum]|uniref:Uncharacterized protein n=1 Tax=Punica granatum TaxID=22663 RepID=A0A2I0IMQ2_PUNGR|nr:hypothetical protein CRG98_034309 [Punica granatum]
MLNQQAKHGNLKNGCLVKLNAESTGQARKSEEGWLLKVNAASTGPAEKGEEGECLLKVNAKSTRKARKPVEGVLSQSKYRINRQSTET